MENLTKMSSVRPKAGEGLAKSEIEKYAEQVPDWEIIETDDVPRLKRVYKFRNFSQALAFTVQVGVLAEKEDHHPALTTEWGKVTVLFWTHAIQGLHLNDFICAAKTDSIYG
jgi:4a-hydroxytetrahydrobiopterin dehydratase